MQNGVVGRTLPLPNQAQQIDHNRVLIINNVGMYDQGTYRCTVQRVHGMYSSKTVNVILQCKTDIAYRQMIRIMNISLILKIDKRNNLKTYIKQYLNMAAIYRRRRHAEFNSQVPTQKCNTLLLTYMRTATGAWRLYNVTLGHVNNFAYIIHYSEYHPWVQDVLGSLVL